MVVSPESQPTRPQVARYKDYRQFMGDFYQFKKSLRSGFSYRRFSQMVGVSSPNYLQLVIQGKRNLSDDLAARVAKALNLTEAERTYFVSMVILENAKSEDARELAEAETLRAVKELVSKEFTKKEATHIVGRWYHMLVRELVLLPDFEPSGEWISEKLRGLITEEEAEQSLSMLLGTGFLRVDKGRYIQSDPVVDTGHAFNELVAFNYHVESLKTLARALPLTEKQNRELGLINIPINSAKMPELIRRIRKFQDEVIGWLQEEESPDRIVQLGTYLVPITKKSPPSGRA